MDLITISDISPEKRSSKNKPYWTVVTDQGNMNCWDATSFQGLSECFKQGLRPNVEIELNGDYKNIKKFLGASPAIDKDLFPQVIKTDQAINQAFGTPSVVRGDPKTATMYTSYAKDVFIALTQSSLYKDNNINTQLMKECIKLVKQARDAF